MFGRINRIPILILAVLMITALVVAAAVAVPGGPRMGGKKMCRGGRCMQQAAERLGLTVDQKTQIQTIVKNHREQIRQVMQSNLSRDEKRAQVQSLRKEMKGAVAQVLTPEQREKTKQMRAEARKQMKQRFQERMKVLGLSQGQLDQIKSVKKAGMEKMKAIRANTNLKPEERVSQMRAARKETREQVMSVLTPEQREKLQQMHPKMGQGKRQQGAACKLQPKG